MNAPMQRTLISSGTPWEPKIGYSRAVKVGNMVFVAGTMAADEHGTIVAPTDAYEQTRYAIRKIERALAQAGATLSHVVRTRMFVRRLEDFDAVGRAHGEFFRDIRPASTMIECGRLNVPEGLIEIEADAVIHDA